MNEAIELISLMSTIVCNQTKVDVEEVSTRLFSRIKSREFKKVLNFTHKFHQNYNIKLKNCDEFHCIECLVENRSEGICKHDNRITPYENSLIISLKDLYPQIEYYNFLFMKCRICKSMFETSELDSSACKCPICSTCFLERYKQRELNCYICGTHVGISRISQIQDDLNISLPEYSKCKSCDLVFEHDALKKKKCYICRSAN